MTPDVDTLVGWLLILGAAAWILLTLTTDPRHTLTREDLTHG